MDAGAVGQIPWDAFNSGGSVSQQDGCVGMLSEEPPDACDAVAGAQCAQPTIHCALPLAALLELKCVDRQRSRQTRALELL